VIKKLDCLVSIYLQCGRSCYKDFQSQLGEKIPKNQVQYLFGCPIGCFGLYKKSSPVAQTVFRLNAIHQSSNQSLIADVPSGSTLTKIFKRTL